MLGENQKISPIQMERQYQMVFFAPLLLLTSKELQGGMGMLALTIAMPLIWLACVWLHKSLYMYRRLGKYMIFFQQVFLVVAGVFVAVQASELITEYMIQGIPRWFVIVVFVVVSLALGNRPEERGRFAEVTWPVVSGVVGIFFFFALWQGARMMVAGTVDFGWLQSGFWDFSWEKLWKNILIVLLFMLGTCLFPFVDFQQESEEVNPWFWLRIILKISLWVSAAIFLEAIYFGAKGAEALPYPLLDLMSGVQLPGNFVRRLDLIFLTVMLFALLFTMGSICFYSGHLWEQANLSMGRWPIVALIFALVLSLSGCQIVEPEKRAYPLVLGIDWTGEEYEIYLAMAKLAQSTGQEKAGSQQDANMLVLKGKNNKEIQKMYDASEELYLDVGHVQALVLSEALLKDKERTFSILLELEQNHDLGNSPYVFRTADMKGLFEKNGKQIESLGDYLTGLYENRMQKRTPRTLMDVYRTVHNEKELPWIPTLVALEDKIELKE